ncbi:hypothetical protein DA2_2863 [Desulfovibrio sp. A2]|nr:hypothetical protein DA2_2863 [Desulfovibrio sp. A2]
MSGREAGPWSARWDGLDGLAGCSGPFAAAAWPGDAAPDRGACASFGSGPWPWPVRAPRRMFSAASCPFWSLTRHTPYAMPACRACLARAAHHAGGRRMSVLRAAATRHVGVIQAAGNNNSRLGTGGLRTTRITCHIAWIS